MIGSTLSWRLTDPHRLIAGGVVPSFIDWGDSLHSAPAAPQDAQLIELRAMHPDTEAVRGILDGLDLDLPVDAGPSPALIADTERNFRARIAT